MQTEYCVPVKVIKAITQEQIVPLYNDEILSEYRDVLSRAKFGLDSKLIELLIQTFQEDGILLDSTI